MTGDPALGMITVPRGNVQDLFDIVTSSMDFGSGFLDVEQIEMLRGVAVLLGVDPMTATPFDQAYRYPHPFVSSKDGNGVLTGRCRTCSRPADLPAHSAGVDLSERDEDR